jgi:serine/threonine protein kinase
MASRIIPEQGAHLLVGNWILYDIIDKGNFGEVRYCKPKNGDEELKSKLCAKKLTKENQNPVSLARESEISFCVSHRNLVNYIDTLETHNNLYFIMEFYPEKSLRNFIKQQKARKINSQPLKPPYNYITQIVNGCRHLYHKGIIHRDIKPENIMLDNSDTIKIGDFGFGKLIEEMEEKLAHTRMGTPFYASPQILRGQKFSSKCDVWSCGILFYELIYGAYPYNQGTNQKEEKYLNIKDLLDAFKNFK